MNQYVSYQGIAGAYSHLACQSVAADYTPLPCVDFKAAIQAVQNGSASCAVLPVDNIIAGRVAAIHELLPGTGLHIINEYNLKINHRLMVAKGTKLKDIKEVYSHMHALPQCSHYIEQFGWAKKPVGDTATAAKLIRDQNNPAFAAIASPEAAEEYGLEIIAGGIANKLYDEEGNQVNNFTRFIVMAPKPVYPSVDETDVKTSLIFDVENHAGSVAQLITSLAENEINISKFESYNNYKNKLARIYFELDANVASVGMKKTLETLDNNKRNYEIWGCYPAATPV